MGRSGSASFVQFLAGLLVGLLAASTVQRKAPAQPISRPQPTTSAETPTETVPYRQFTPQDGLPHASVRHLAQTPDGRLWIGTNAGLAVYDGHEIRPVSLPDSIERGAVGDFFMQKDGTLWVDIVERGLVALRDGHVTRVLPPPEDPNHTIRLLARRDTLFAVTASALWILPPDADTFEKTPYTYAEGVPSASGTFSVYRQSVVAADRAPDGTLWVLTSHRGLARLAPDGSITVADIHLPTLCVSQWTSERLRSDLRVCTSLGDRTCAIPIGSLRTTRRGTQPRTA